MNSEQMIFLILLIFLIIVLFVGVFPMYIETRKLFGRVAACRSLRWPTRLALGALLYFGVGFAIFSFFMRFSIAASILFLPLLLGMIGYVSTWHQRQHRAGVVLLILGRYDLEHSNAVILVGGLLIANAVHLVFSALSSFLLDSETALLSLIYATYSGLIGIFLIWLNLRHIEIRSRGICYQFTVIKWEVIAAYRWIGYEQNILVIRHQAKWPFNPVLKLKISLEHKNSVKQILSQYLPAESNLS